VEELRAALYTVWGRPEHRLYLRLSNPQFGPTYSTYYLCSSHIVRNINKFRPLENQPQITIIQKGDPSILSNHRPIALANTIYKFFTSTLTFILSAYGEKHQILQDSREGFQAEWCTSKQIKTLITTLEDAQFTN
jgi:hypothetical protein